MRVPRPPPEHLYDGSDRFVGNATPVKRERVFLGFEPEPARRGLATELRMKFDVERRDIPNEQAAGCVNLETVGGDEICARSVDARGEVPGVAARDNGDDDAFHLRGLGK